MAAPNPEELYDPTVLTPEEAIEVEAVSQRRPVGVLQVGLALAAAFLIYQRVIQRRLEKTTAPTPELMERALVHALKDSFIAFTPNWVKMVSPLMYAGYLVGVKQSGVTLPKTVLEQMSDGYSESLGNYIHQTSSHAMLSGFRALVNRKVDHRRALLQTSSAFGVGPRTMNALVNVWSAEEPKAYTNVKRIGSAKDHRAKLIITKSLKDRAKAIGEHEAWNAKEQAKEASWMYALQSGAISGAADKVWLTRENERVCSSCGPLDGMKVPVDGKFETKLGKTMTPPLHVGCGCEIQLKASLKRILLGQLRKQPVKKAYEGHPWARHQQRNEEGEWVKGPSSAHGQPQPALAPAYEPEEPPPAPPPAPPQQAQRFKLQLGPPQTGQPFKMNLAPPQAAPPFKLELQPPAAPPFKLQLNPPPATPPPQVSTPAPAPFKLELQPPPQKTPVSEITYREEEQQQNDPFKAGKPSIITLERGHELYGVMPDSMETNAAEVTLNDVDVTPSKDGLRSMVESKLADRYENSIQNEFESLQNEYTAKPTKPVLNQSGRQHFADEDEIRSLVEWARARQLAQQHDDDIRDWTQYHATITTTTNYDSKPHQLAAEELYDKVKIDGLLIPDLLNTLMPAVVVIPRVDSEVSTQKMDRTGPDGDPDWVVRGKHHNYGRTEHVVDPVTGARIGADTFRIDPLD